MKNLILLFVIALLWWAYYLQINQDKQNFTPKDINYPFSFSTLYVDELSYVNSNWSGYSITWTWSMFSISDKSKWSIFEADESIIKQLLEEFKWTEFTRLASDKKTSWADFGITWTSSYIQVWWKKIFLWTTWRNEFYISIDWDSNIYGISKPIEYFFHKDINYFRDKKIYTTTPNINKIETKKYSDVKVYSLNWTWWTLSWTATDVSSLLTLKATTISNENDLKEIWYIKYLESESIVKEFTLLWDEKNTFIKKLDEYYRIDLQ